MNRRKFFRLLSFVAFSISAGVIRMASFALFEELCSWEYWPSYLLSFVLPVVWNFTWNRKFTFRSAGNVPVAMAAESGEDGRGGANDRGVIPLFP